ncbi:MAG TPA: SDR family oxidoreductase [Beijerinckiaceae bacterium]|jgi:NAD(P)-dependent dehydrogenase (short-subunit alcohol dehydrogenase family)|nr:3-hydroxyacyl-CoA dehydrogenase, binding domain protein [Microvirga sp.]HZB37256.1 SDR family oxidoreductase [Beijerinckiaceae bacterium]
MGRLEGKVAIVTGGAGGIGSATGRLFCEEGARIVLVDRDADQMHSVLAEMRSAVPNPEVLGIVADVGEESFAKRIVDDTLGAFGAIDVLVNNAGIRSYEPLADAKAETWHAILSVNLLSYAYLTREALPALRRSGRGSIVNVSSTHAFNPRAGMGQYDVTKAGIVSMTRTLAFEEAPHVRVNAICPGATFTTFHKRRAEALSRSQEEVDREAATTCLLRRWADPREIAYPILWLASDEASYVTASALMADGGRLVI